MLITKNIKMADVIHMNYFTLSVLNRFGIELGFGDKTVEQVSALMRRAMENPEEAKNKNKEMNDLIDKKYTWDKVINLTEERLNEVLKK